MCTGPDCDQRARDWAYMHNDENERIDPVTGHAYTANLDAYTPMCSSHHRQYDA